MRAIALLLCSVLLFGLTACDVASARQSASDRLFLNLSLEFLDEYRVPKQTFAGAPFGGISAIAYDRQRDRLYALSDDRSHFGPARFYTLRLAIADNRIATFDIESATTLKTEGGEPFPEGSLDPEGVAIAPGDTLYVSSEGDARRGIPPFIDRFDLASGRRVDRLQIPERYLPDGEGNGIRNNRGFEALSLGTTSFTPGDPYRLFAATESALRQDVLPPESPDSERTRSRLLHYAMNGVSAPNLVAEHVYLLDRPTFGTVANGLTELLALPTEGYFLTLERTYNPLRGNGAKLFQMTIANATDTSQIAAIEGSLGQIEPLKKQLLLDLSALDLDLDNLEAMTLGPRLSDGTLSLLLASDDNFSSDQVTQLLLFRLVKGAE